MTYRAAICTALVGPEAIEIQTLAVSKLKPGEVRIAIKAAGLNFPDLLMTQGAYQFRPDPPFTPGIEFAGIVLEVAGDVTGISAGDTVIGSNKGGSFAEQIVVSQNAILPLPASFTFAEGACWQTAAITAWHGLHDKANLQKNECVLILGASGGAGMAAIKLAKHIGAIVIALASNEAKRTAVLSVGADYALDPSSEDLPAQIKSLTDGKGADVVFDPVGGDLAIKATRAIAWGGRYLIVGFASGIIPQFPANHALIKGYSLIGMRAGESSRRDPQLAERNQKALQELGQNGIMRPHLSHQFSLSDTAQAIAALEQRIIIGRGVIMMD
jgi:NADPH:quinone reductase